MKASVDRTGSMVERGLPGARSTRLAGRVHVDHSYAELIMLVASTSRKGSGQSFGSHVLVAVRTLVSFWK